MKVSELLENESKWTQSCMARDKLDRKITFYSRFATKWSLFGAIRKCYNGYAGPILEKVKERVGMDIPKWEDDMNRNFEDLRELIVELGI